jgi:alkylhydroperoxidase family enzyme
VAQALQDWRSPALREELRATLGFLERLTLAPDEVGAEDVERVLAAGVSAEALADAIHVCALFDVIDRIADSLGFDMPPDDYFRSRAGPFLEQGYALPP